MNIKEMYKISVATTDMFIKMYLSDFSDADMLVRPDSAANHSAWQIGHFIGSEYNMIEAIKPGHSVKLPAGFLERHTKDTKDINDPAAFLTKAEYLDLYDLQRSATLEAFQGMSEADLSKPGPEKMQALAPTIGALMNIAAIHPLLHCGQFVLVRRKLGKPVLV